MTEIQDFKRIEKKYVLTLAQYSALRQAISSTMQQDKYGNYTVNSLYYDTLDYQLIRHSLSRPAYKEKLRFRYYGDSETSPDASFLEIKKKFRGVVYKRRIPMTSAEATSFIQQPPTSSDNIVTLEMIQLLKRYPLVPSVWLRYQRQALFDPQNPDFRITFDQQIRFDTQRISEHSNQILPDSKVLMEVKIPQAMPLWFSKICTELKIYPQTFSKYGRCYQNYLLPQLTTTHRVLTNEWSYNEQTERNVINYAS